MKICLVQTDIAWNRPADNLERVARLVRAAEKADVYVLPEMFATGFVMDPLTITEGSFEMTAAWMQAMADEADAVVAGSMPCRDGCRFYNRFCWMAPHSEPVYYDKRHLFGYGGETAHYSGGNQRVTVAFRGVRFLPMVCYDLRFPVWSRNHGDYDVALYVANWPGGRQEVWETLLKARAIENQCYVAGVNRIGTGDGIQYVGGSMLVDPYGKVAARCEGACETCVTTELNMTRLQNFRKKFRVLDDADEFEIRREP